MTKRRESRSGRNQVIWDQALHWGKKKKISERSERRGRSGEGKGWLFFSFPRPPLGSLRSPICFLFDPVFYLLSPLLETKRERGGFLPSLFPSHYSLASFSCSLFFGPFPGSNYKNNTLARRYWLPCCLPFRWVAKISTQKVRN